MTQLTAEMKQVIVLAVFNQKGGVGKTTTTENLGDQLVARGRRVLLIDADQQGSLGSALGLDPDALPQTLFDLLKVAANATEEEPVTADQVMAIVVQLPNGLHLLPANQTLADADMDFASQMGREGLIKAIIAAVADRYDYILIDCPPALSLMPINSLVAATHVLLTVPPRFLDARGMAHLVKTVRKVRRLNKQLQVVGAIFTIGKSRRRVQEDMRQSIREFCAAQRPPLDILGEIPEVSTVEGAAREGQTLREFDPTGKATVAYSALADVLIQRLEGGTA